MLPYLRVELPETHGFSGATGTKRVSVTAEDEQMSNWLGG